MNFTLEKFNIRRVVFELVSISHSNSTTPQNVFKYIHLSIVSFKFYFKVAIKSKDFMQFTLLELLTVGIFNRSGNRYEVLLYSLKMKRQRWRAKNFFLSREKKSGDYQQNYLISWKHFVRIPLLTFSFELLFLIWSWEASSLMINWRN